MHSVILYSPFAIRVDNTSIFRMQQAEHVAHQKRAKYSPPWSDGALVRGVSVSRAASGTSISSRPLASLYADVPVLASNIQCSGIQAAIDHGPTVVARS